MRYSTNNMHIRTDIHRFMRPIDIKAFHDEAASQKVYILLRRPNPAARKYIGQPGFAPQTRDCRFKAADQDFFHESLGQQLTVGGLVVNPALNEFDKAFKDQKSYDTAVRLWNEYRDATVDESGQETNARQTQSLSSEGKPFAMNRDADSPFYGCITISPLATTNANHCLHTVYDLYAYIPTSDPKTLERFLTELNTEPQYPEASFSEYQPRLNRRMGLPMIQHAPQELTGQYVDDQVFVFMPDSATVFWLANQLEIREFYRDILAGRRLSSH
jgi:hypothetical protein